MEDAPAPKAQGRMKLIIGGALIIAAIVYLIISSTAASSQYYFTVEELGEKGSEVFGRDLRVSGAVIGDTIDYNVQDLELIFTVAHIPGDQKEIEALGGLSTVLHEAVVDSSLPRLKIMYQGVMPDLLQNEAQAIMTGKLGEDDIFYADELLLKCPTKYEEVLPSQVVNE